MPTLIGAAMIAAAILLSTFINALGTRYIGFEGPTEETAWLVDRLTGSVYKCRAPGPGQGILRERDRDRQRPGAAEKIAFSSEVGTGSRLRKRVKQRVCSPSESGTSSRERIRLHCRAMPRATKPHPLTKTEARRIWLRAQRLDTPAPFGEGPEATAAAVEHLGYVQIDTINVIERCHHHILFSRIPNYRRADLRQAQSVDKSVFEYWTHALSYVPAKDFRFSFRT